MVIRTFAGEQFVVASTFLNPSLIHVEDAGAVLDGGKMCIRDRDCPYLNNVWIPSSVIVGHNAFAQCSNLKHIQIAESVSQETVNTWGLSENCVIEKYKIFKQR